MICAWKVRAECSTAVAVLLWSAAAAAQVSTVQAAQIWFQEREQGTGEYPVRMIVTAQYLRIDDGVDSGDFVLFDRLKGLIYAVNHEESSVLLVSARPVESLSPVQLRQQVETVPLPNSPRVAGHEVVFYRLGTNGHRCLEVAAAAGLLPDAVQAMREYHRALAGEQSEAVRHTPQDLISPCDLTDHVYAPDRHLRYGFPVTLRFESGRQRILKDYREGVRVAPALFDIPPAYQRVHTPYFR